MMLNYIAQDVGDDTEAALEEFAEASEITTETQDACARLLALVDMARCPRDAERAIDRKP